MKRRVTQQDIADKVGLGRSTVSQALLNHPRISKETKRKVLQAAKQIGYVPDPFLSGLASYRNRKRSATYHGQIAWLVNNEEAPYPWRKYPHYLDYFHGAQKRAEQFGYRLDEFSFNHNSTSTAQLRRTLHNRNVTGILLCPQPRAEVVFDFAWDQFSAVAFGYSLRHPALHTVAPAHLLNTRTTMREVAKRGYKRIGLMIYSETDKRCGHNVLAGYLTEQALLSERIDTFKFIKPLINYSAIDDLIHYIKQEKLDALITSDHRILEKMATLGLRAPEHLNVAGLSLPKAQGQLSGVAEDSQQVGAMAIDILVGMMQRGERGIPPMPTRTHLEGVWYEGTSLSLPVTHP